MDCMTFRKLINSYLQDELDDATLNDFIRHMETCEACREELEINFIVERGVQILDQEKGDYNILQAFQKTVSERKTYILNRKNFLRFRYCLETCVFWAVVFSLFIFLRMVFFRQ